MILRTMLCKVVKPGGRLDSSLDMRWIQSISEGQATFRPSSRRLMPFKIYRVPNLKTVVDCKVSPGFRIHEGKLA